METIVDLLNPNARIAPESGIVAVVNAAREREDLIPLWAGEGHLPTPAFICEAAKKSLDRGETFYTYQRGIPALREALAAYHERTFNKRFSSEQFFVTGSGMQAIQLAVQAVCGCGEEVIIPSPAWPNAAAAVGIHGGRAVFVRMQERESTWDLQLADIEAAITAKTTAIFLNSPCNPNGWVASRSFLNEVLKLARRHNIWIIADEIYSLFYFGDEQRAPLFYDVAEVDDQIIFVNTFSKNWAMTGWRIGWISAPIALGQTIENLVQYSTSGVPTFTQYGAVAALEDGSDFLAKQVERASLGRKIVMRGLQSIENIKIIPPRGAFYAFFSIDGIADTRELAFKLVQETGVGLAPGTAFGPGGEPYLRLCFARDANQLETAMERLKRWFH